MGINSDRVVNPEKLPPDLFCPICEDLIDPADAIQAEPCGHMFCGPCIQQTVRVHGLCPQDREPVSAKQLKKVKEGNPFVYRLLGRTAVKCARFQEGCEWAGEVSEAASHQVRCGKEWARCARCREMLLRERLADHHRTCRACTECEAKDAQLAEARAQLKEKKVLGLRVAELTERLHALQGQQEADRTLAYDHCTAVDIAGLLARNLRSKARELDRSRLFARIKSCVEEWERSRGQRSSDYNLGVHFMLTASLACSWFSDTQKVFLDTCLTKVCLHKIGLDMS